MNGSVAKAFHAQAEQCFRRSIMTSDEKIKKHWDELADDWLALESKQNRIEAGWRAIASRQLSDKIY
jgi:hypothetical protein